jgi:hypothetical protein
VADPVHTLALTVACPDCMAPAGTDCRTSLETVTDQTIHADRISAAEYAVNPPATAGTCDLCGLPVGPPLGCPAHGFTSVTAGGTP